MADSIGARGEKSKWKRGFIKGSKHLITDYHYVCVHVEHPSRLR